MSISVVPPGSAVSGSVADVWPPLSPQPPQMQSPGPSPSSTLYSVPCVY